MTRTRILASTLALVAFGGLTACDPEQVVEDVLTLDVIRHTISDAGIHHPAPEVVLPPIVETPVVTVPPEAIPVPEQDGWTWDRVTLTVTNIEVSPSIQVLAYYGPYERPLMPVVYLAPGQSVTIPTDLMACGELMVVAVDQKVVEPDFAVC